MQEISAFFFYSVDSVPVVVSLGAELRLDDSRLVLEAFGGAEPPQRRALDFGANLRRAAAAEGLEN